MSRRDEAIRILSQVRCRILDRLTAVVIDSRRFLEGPTAVPNDPLAVVPQLSQLSKALREVDDLIAAIRNQTNAAPDEVASTAPDKTVDSSNGDEVITSPIFGPYVHLVRRTRLEEASRYLSRMFRLPQDRVITATRYFTRCYKAEPAVAKILDQLCNHVEDWSESDCVKALIHTFGFQAVEARVALAALRERKDRLDPVSA